MGSDRRRLRIAVLGPCRFGLGEPFAGGLEAHTACLARHLRSAGHEVSIHAGPVGAPAPPDLAVRPIMEAVTVAADPGRRLDVFNTAERLRLEHDGYLTTLGRLVADGVDVVHNTSLHHLPPVLEPDLDLAMVHSLHTPRFDWLEQAHRYRADRGPTIVAAVSTSLARQWDGLATDVVLNGIDTSHWRPIGVEREGGHAVWSGRIVPEKGPHLAIEAARRAGWRLTLAGPLQDPDYVEREIRPRLGPDITLAGHLDTRALRRLYGSGEVGLVTPCWDEPFGLVAAEMLACGLPVAAIDRGAMAEIVEPSVGVLAPTKADVTAQSEALAEALIAAATVDPATCRKYAVNRLSAGVMAEAYVDLYRRRLQKSTRI